MGKLFNYDSGLIQFLNKIVDCAFLSILWLLFSLPLFTMGAATTALYYTANKVIRHSRSHVLREFWGSFKSNFKQSTIMNLILMVFYFFVIENIYLYYLKVYNGIVGKPLLIFNVILGIVLLAWSLHVFPFIARFENNLKAIAKLCAYFMIRHAGATILLLLSLGVACLLLWFFPFLIFVMPAFYMLVATFILEPIYRRYMSDEDLQAEEERNMVYYN